MYSSSELGMYSSSESSIVETVVSPVTVVSLVAELLVGLSCTFFFSGVLVGNDVGDTFLFFGFCVLENGFRKTFLFVGLFNCDEIFVFFKFDVTTVKSLPKLLPSPITLKLLQFKLPLTILSWLILTLLQNQLLFPCTVALLNPKT